MRKQTEYRIESLASLLPQNSLYIYSMALKMQEKYQLNLKQEEDNWTKTMEELENGKKELSEVVTNLSVVGIGDSIMLGAVNNLYQKFPNGYFDAQISRTAWLANSILKKLKSKPE